MSTIAVIGIGNTLMGDDGAGVAVAERLKLTIERARVVSGHCAGMGLMRDVLAADTVIFVDAITVGDEPGSIYRFDPDDAGITGLRSTTSHGMGIPYLITNARLQGHFPRFIVYAIHVGDIMCGPDTLTPAVDSACDEVARLVAEEVTALSAKGVEADDADAVDSPQGAATRS